ncbi:hypothetical protein BVX97_03640 [bacterium E08(2017)]|nr:hypothetical protein BVX97_03640 [bacterium E08(2017)]
MKEKEICKSGSIFVWLGITSMAFALVPIYFLGKHLVLPDGIPLNSIEMTVLWFALGWMVLSVFLTAVRRRSVILPDGFICIKYTLWGMSLKRIDLGPASDCTFSISENTVRFHRLSDDTDVVNIEAFSLKSIKPRVLGTYLSLEEAEQELATLHKAIDNIKSL